VAHHVVRQLWKRADGRYDLETFPPNSIRFEDIVRETGLTVDQAMDRAFAPPEVKELMFFQGEGDEKTQVMPGDLPDVVKACTKIGQGFRPFKSCDRCDQTGVVDGAPCPKCR
jgi:hypothetical protein